MILNVIFLDYDGVVNTFMYIEKPIKNHMSSRKWNINGPNDNCVNNIQAIYWLNQFCEERNYKIIVSSAWKIFKNYKECLINAGLEAEIIGRTEDSSNESNMFATRGCSEEIASYLFDHPEIQKYIILDDNSVHKVKIEDKIFNLNQHIILCDCFDGFTHEKFKKAESIDDNYNAIG